MMRAVATETTQVISGGSLQGRGNAPSWWLGRPGTGPGLGTGDAREPHPCGKAVHACGIASSAGYSLVTSCG